MDTHEIDAEINNKDGRSMNDLEYTQECLAAIRPYISGMAESCSYCDRIEPLILQKGFYTYITLAIGQIVEGYLQVCASSHRTSATGLYTHETQELVMMKAIIRKAYEEVYGNKGVAFEHGEAGSCLWGEDKMKNMRNLCHHTHIHFIPVVVDIRYQIKKYLPDEIKINSILELKSIRETELKGDSYLYFENVDEVGYVYPVNNRPIPRQFLRTCIAEELGVPEKSDWITYPGEEYFYLGKNKLKPVLEKLYNQLIKNEQDSVQ